LPQNDITKTSQNRIAQGTLALLPELFFPWVFFPEDDEAFAVFLVLVPLRTATLL
jgi:hypothetical protein